MHERCARSDGIRIPSFFSLRGNLLAHCWKNDSEYITLPQMGKYNAPFHSASASKRASYFSRASWAERNRRDRCWFIFALGATPSWGIVYIRWKLSCMGNSPMAMKSNFRGRIMFTTRSVYLKTSTIISSSVSGAGFPSGCVQGWTYTRIRVSAAILKPIHFENAQCRSYPGRGCQIPYH